jgi:acyl-CoA thioesterase FadM
MSHLTEIKVRGYHLDLYRHVNNARYLEFLEEARWSLLESRATLDYLQSNGYAFVVVNININYPPRRVHGGHTGNLHLGRIHRQPKLQDATTGYAQG